MIEPSPEDSVRHWGNGGSSEIRRAPLASRGAVDTLYASAQGVFGPIGVAIDPNPAGPAPERLAVGDAERFPVGRWLRDLFSRPSGSPGRIYWGNGGDNTIRGAPLAGGGTPDTLYDSGKGVSSPSAVAVLRAPVGTGAPTISWSLILDDEPFGGLQFGGSHSGPLGQRLSCSQGAWAADLPGSFLYRAPQSVAYQWRLGGNDISGATAADYTPNAPGSYTCQVTATNGAGSAVQTSAAVTVS